MAPIEIRLLGRFEVRIGGDALPDQAWRRRHPAAIVKLLALAPGRRLHREQVLDALWPDVEPAVAAARLHKAAHFVRRATGRADAIELAGDSVALFPDAPVIVDVAVFEALATDDPVAALAVYGGDLLPTDPYEPWLERDRDRLRLLRTSLLRQARRWEDLLALDPTDEEAHVALMRQHLGAGRAAAVLRQYERLRRALHDELDLEPGGDARALRDRAAAGLQDRPGRYCRPHAWRTHRPARSGARHRPVHQPG